MKCLVVLAFVALAAAVPFSGNQKDIRIGDDGSIIVSVPGKRVMFSKSSDNEKFLDISVRAGTNIRKIQIDDKNQIVKDVSYSFSSSDWNLKISTVGTKADSKSKKSSSSSNLQLERLHTIFREYQGIIDDVTYQHLLQEVKQAVDDAFVHQVIYDVLFNFDNVNSFGPQYQNQFGFEYPQTNWPAPRFGPFQFGPNKQFSSFPYGQYGQFNKESSVSTQNAEVQGQNQYPFYQPGQQYAAQYPFFKSYFKNAAQAYQSAAQNYGPQNGEQQNVDSILSQINNLREQSQQLFDQQQEVNQKFQNFQTEYQQPGVSPLKSQEFQQTRESLINQREDFVKQQLDIQQQIQQLYQQLRSTEGQYKPGYGQGVSGYGYNYPGQFQDQQKYQSQYPSVYQNQYPSVYQNQPSGFRPYAGQYQAYRPTAAY